MKDQVVLKSESIVFWVNTLFLLLCGIGMLTGAPFCMSSAFSGPYQPQILPFVFGAILGVSGVWILVYTYNSLNRIFIFSDRLEIKSFFGNTRKSILLDDIYTYTETEQTNKNEKWTELTCYTENTHFTIVSSNYQNYLELRTALVKDKKMDVKKIASSENRTGIFLGIVLTAIGLLCMYGVFYQYSTKDDKISSSDFQTISGTIANNAEIIKGSKGAFYSHYIKPIPGK